MCWRDGSLTLSVTNRPRRAGEGPFPPHLGLWWLLLLHPPQLVERFFSCNHGVVGGKAQYFWLGLTPLQGQKVNLAVLNLSCVCLMMLLQLCGNCPQRLDVDWDLVSLPALPEKSPSRPSRMRSAVSSGRSPPPSPSCRCWRRPVSSHIPLFQPFG